MVILFFIAQVAWLACALYPEYAVHPLFVGVLSAYILCSSVQDITYGEAEPLALLNRNILIPVSVDLSLYTALLTTLCFSAIGSNLLQAVTFGVYVLVFLIVLPMARRRTIRKSELYDMVRNRENL